MNKIVTSVTLNGETFTTDSGARVTIRRKTPSGSVTVTSQRSEYTSAGSAGAANRVTVVSVSKRTE